MELQSKQHLIKTQNLTGRGTPDLVSGRIIRPDSSLFHYPFRIVCFSKKMRKCTGKPLLIVLATNCLCMLCKRVISPQELTQFTRTKLWPKLKVVSFGRFGLSNGVDNLFFPKVKFQKWSQYNTPPPLQLDGRSLPHVELAELAY